MPQPSMLTHKSARHGRVGHFCALALILVLLIGADIWLVFQFAKAAAMVLAELNVLLIAMLATFGRAIMTAGALLLTWLLIEDLRDVLRGDASAGNHNFYTR